MVSRAARLLGPGWLSSATLWSLLAGNTHPGAQAVSQMPFRDKGQGDLVLYFSSLLIFELALSFGGMRKFSFWSAPSALWSWVRIKDAHWPSALPPGVSGLCGRAEFTLGTLGYGESHRLGLWTWLSVFLPLSAISM